MSEGARFRRWYDWTNREWVSTRLPDRVGQTPDVPRIDELPLPVEPPQVVSGVERVVPEGGSGGVELGPPTGVDHSAKALEEKDYRRINWDEVGRIKPGGQRGD